MVSTDSILKGYTFTLLLIPLIWVAFPLFLNLSLVQGQDYYEHKDLRFRHFQIRDGLPSNTIQTVFEDSQGLIWLGTQIGLVRYDGYTFSLLLTEEEDYNFKQSSIHKLLEDAAGFLWVGTYRHGLYRYDPRTGSLDHFDTSPSNGRPQAHVSDLAQDSSGQVWAITTNSVIVIPQNSLDSSFHFLKMEHEHHPHLDGITSAKISKSGEIWLSGRNQLLRVSNTTSAKPLFHEINVGLEFSAKTMQIDSADNIWLAGRFRKNDEIHHGFIKYQPDAGNTASYQLPSDHYPIYDFQLNDDGFWIATFGDGISKIDSTQITIADPSTYEIKSTTHYEFTSDQDFAIGRNHARCIYKDQNGSIWVGTWLQGLYQMSPSVNLFKHYRLPRNLRNENQTVFMVQEDGDGKYWISSYLNGLFYYDSKLHLFQSFHPEDRPNRGTGSHISMDLFRDRKNQLWTIGGNRTINLYDPDNHSFEKFRLGNHLLRENKVPPWVNHAFLHGIAEDKNGHFWIGSTGLGLTHFDPVSKTALAHYLVNENDSLSLGSNNILRVTIDEKDRVWLSCDGMGLYQKVHRSDSSVGFKACTRQVNTIYSIVSDGKGSLWLATLSEGLVKYDVASGQTQHFTSEHGLPHECILDITVDSIGNFWLITPHGLGYFDPVTQQCDIYGSEYGLNFDQRLMNKGQMSGQDILFANTDGFYVVTSDKLRERQVTPAVSLTSLHLANKEIVPGNRTPLSMDINYLDYLELSHRQNDLAISYAGIHYDNPQELRYAYYLEGLQSDWIAVDKERIARFPNTPPGQYQFNVRASIDGQHWGATKSLLIKITPPWWWTTTAKVLYLISFLLIAYSLNRFQLLRKLQEAETARLRELDRFKTHLYTNLTHEFRTPLTVITGMAKEILNNPKDWFREGLSMIIANAERVRKLTNEMLALSKLESGNLKVNLQKGDFLNFIQFIVSSFESYAQQNELKIHFWTDEKTLIIDFDQDKMTTILSNLISNAVKFTPADGDIYVRCRRIDGPELDMKSMLELTIKDTGIGISEEDLSKVFDRFYQARESNAAASVGTGIGLSLSKELIELLGGSITVESTLGRGTSFIIQLPITQTADDEFALNEEELDESLRAFMPAATLLPEVNAHPCKEIGY